MKQQFTQEQVAENLLFPLWRCIDDSYKDRYKKDIWEQFENNIRNAAYTNRLQKFLEKIKSLMSITMQAQYAKRVLSIINSGQDDEIMNWLRSETVYLILSVRILNQERKETFNELVQTDIDKPEEIEDFDNFNL